MAVNYLFVNKLYEVQIFILCFCSHGDKVRHMAKQKADAQRRLFKRRNDAKKSAGNKRDVILSKRKEDLVRPLSNPDFAQSMGITT